MHGLKTKQVLAQLREYKIIPVIRTNSPVDAYQVVSILNEIGFKTVEITMTVPNAANLIKQLNDEKRNLLIGAGTIINREQAEKCIKAGAKYIVSPFMVEEVLELCLELDIPCIMSGLTPTEINNAWLKHSPAIKVFPIHSMGGSEYLKSLKAIFPTIPLVPTGGVNLNNIDDYLKAGAEFVGVGNDLVNIDLVNNDINRIKEIGMRFLDKVFEHN